MPNRDDFARTTANAYVDQFSVSGERVMNEMIIVYDGEDFGSQSSLTPLGEDEILILALVEGMFGDVDADAQDTVASIYDYLTDDASDDLWWQVNNAIDEAENFNW